MKRRIIFYRLNDGKSPVEEYLDKLAPLQAQKVIWVLKLIEDMDRVPSKFLKKITGTDDLWECRVRVGANNYRLIGFPIENTFVVTNAFMKKQNRIPLQELDLAHKYRQDHLRRCNNV